VATETVALDTVVQIAPGADSLDLALTVEVSSLNELFRVTMKFITPTGDTAFTGGPITVTPTPADVTVPEPVEVGIIYVGVGAHAAGVVIAESDTSVSFGDSLLLTASALDDQGEVIEGTPIAWSSTDTMRARVADPAAGKIRAGTNRGAVQIIASLLTDHADTVNVTVQPVPATAVVTSGNDQTGEVGIALAQPLGLQVIAQDELGVQDVRVIFAVQDDGSVGGSGLTHDTVLTNSQGVAQTTWTLGSARGAQSVTATVSRIADSVLVFTALATAGEARAIEVVSGDGQTATVGATLPQPLVVLATDVFGNPVPQAEITWFVDLASGTISPTTDTADANGVATALWTLGTVAGANQAGAYLTAFDAPPAASQHGDRNLGAPPEAPAATTVYFTATGTPGPSAALVFTQEPTSIAAGSLLDVDVTVMDVYGSDDPSRDWHPRRITARDHERHRSCGHRTTHCILDRQRRLRISVARVSSGPRQRHVSGVRRQPRPRGHRGGLAGVRDIERAWRHHRVRGYSQGPVWQFGDNRLYLGTGGLGGGEC
jgi:hypothetical protein